MRLSNSAGGLPAALDPGLFPLRLSSRHVLSARGTPLLLHGDAPWSINVQLTQPQVDTYLNDRTSRGFNAILFEVIERLYSNNSPAYLNRNGDQPFTTMSPVSWNSRVNAYWSHVDYIVNGAKAHGMVCFITPAYMGFNNNQNGDGWVSDTDAASAGDLQNYGAFLASRYNQGNVIWVMGGDYAGTTAQRDKQWNIAVGIRSLDPSALLIGHPARADGDGYSLWGPGGQNYAGWNLNSVYTNSTDVVSEAATAYGRSPARPAIGIEFWYENENSMTTNGLAYQAVQAYLSGCCGHFFGNNPLWGFGEPTANGGAGAAAALASALNTPGAQAMTHVGSLLRTYAWWRLEPKTDASLVSTALGTGTAATCPARDSSSQFALIGKNNAASITVVLSALSKGSLRARWYDPTAGTFTNPAEGTSFSNAGSQTFAHPGNNSAGSTAWVLVID